MSDVTVKVDMSIKKGLFERFGQPDDRTMLEIHDLLAKEFNDYVPMDEGVLSQSVEVSAECIRYPGPYAHYMYVGEVYGPNFPIFDKDTGELIGWRSPKGKKKHPTGREIQYGKEKHPLATKEWDKAAMADRGDSIRQQVKEILIRSFRDGNR